jgi:Integron cassette protein VCH_CASS1 chain
MPEKLTEISALQRYLSGVVNRAEHHAPQVRGIAFTLIGAVIWCKDASPAIEVKIYDGQTANVLWVWICGKRYAFSYAHASGTIELRQDNMRGDVLHSFDDTTSVSEVFDVFEKLKSDDERERLAARQ